jgi:hypothetical protein
MHSLLHLNYLCDYSSFILFLDGGAATGGVQPSAFQASTDGKLLSNVLKYK